MRDHVARTRRVPRLTLGCAHCSSQTVERLNERRRETSRFSSYCRCRRVCLQRNPCVLLHASVSHTCAHFESYMLDDGCYIHGTQVRESRQTPEGVHVEIHVVNICDRSAVCRRASATHSRCVPQEARTLTERGELRADAVKGRDLRQRTTSCMRVSTCREVHICARTYCLGGENGRAGAGREAGPEERGRWAR